MIYEFCFSNAKLFLKRIFCQAQTWESDSACKKEF